MTQKKSCILLVLSIASLSCLAQYSGAQALSKFMETEDYIESMDSTFAYTDIKANISSFDPVYMDDIQMYNLAIFMLDKHQDTTSFLHLIRNISSNAFPECLNPFSTDDSRCLLEWLEEDFISLGLLDSDLYLESLKIFNAKTEKLALTYSSSLQRICDSLRSEDQKIRMALVERWNSLSYDSIRILMKPQNRIDSSNAILFDDIIRKHGFPGYNKVSSDLIFLMLQHVQDQSKYIPYLEDLAKNNQISWDEYRGIFYRYYTTPYQEIKPFPFIIIDKSGEAQVAQRSLDYFLEKVSRYRAKKGYTIHYYVTNEEMVKKLETILGTQENMEIHLIPTHKRDRYIYYTIEL